MKHAKILPIFFFSLLLLMASCSKNEITGNKAPNLSSTRSDFLGKNASTGAVKETILNGVTDAGAQLGKVLFYEKLLSTNNSASCNSCHKQQNGFGALAHPSSWDGQTNTLKSEMTTGKHHEMGLENLSGLSFKLKTANYYPALFEAAFGTPEITDERIASALAQFIKAMAGSNSRYDVGSKTSFVNFTEKEKEGMQLYASLECKSCHGGGNSGSGNEIHSAPSLRNISLAGPYMHDGSAKTLDEAVAHSKVGMSGEETEALKSFLLTLRDDQLIADPKFLSPFN